MFRRAHPLSRLVVGVVVSAAMLACGGGGGGGGGSQSPPPPPISTFNAGFGLRQDVQLGLGGVTDGEAVDLNGDGRWDIVETDFSTMRISSALGNANGSFTPSFELPTPGTPWKLELDDVTGDGLLDIAVICSAVNGGLASLAVYRGLGGGAFVHDATTILPVDPLDIAIGRVSGATLAQIFVAIPAHGVWQFERSAAGVLTEVRQLPRSTGSFRSFTVALLDVDGDAVVDVVVGEIGDSMSVDQVVAHISDGRGDYLPPTVLSQAEYPLVENAGDVDGDGTDDLIVSQLESGSALLYLGGPTGLGAALSIQFDGATSSVLFVDVNGDGDKDVAATLIDDSAIAVRLASAPLTFGPLRLYNVGEAPRWITSGVFGGEPHLDLMCTNIRDVSILHGIGNGLFRGAPGFKIGDEPQFVRVVDMDLDGFVDAVSIDQFQNEVVFMRGNGDGTFVNEGKIPLTPTAIETAGYLLIRDFDRDGRPDVATTVHSAGRVQLMPNAGTLPFDAPQPKDSTPVGNDPLGLDSGDLDGDGELDIVVANSGDDSIQVLIGHGDFTFQPLTPVPVPFRPLVVLLGDWDQNGTLDATAITGNPDGSQSFLLVLRGDGSGGLSLVSAQATPLMSSVLSSGDFDEDGFPDIAASQPRQTADDVLVMMNRGNFQFEIQPLKVGFRMGTLEVLDINRDNHLDLVVPLRDGALVLALGDGTGRFPTILPPQGEQFPAPFGATASAFADLNGDLLPDILAVSPRTPHLWVALNEGTLFQVPVE
jgi:hypothetical protein